MLAILYKRCVRFFYAKQINSYFPKVQSTQAGTVPEQQALFQQTSGCTALTALEQQNSNFLQSKYPYRVLTELFYCSIYILLL